MKISQIAQRDILDRMGSEARGQHRAMRAVVSVQLHAAGGAR